MARMACFALSLITLAAAPAFAGPHVHGLGRMDIAVDGNALSIALELPLDTLTGFERPPRTDAERQRLDSALAALQRPADMIAPSTSAGCSATTTEVTPPFGKDGKASSEHADARVIWRFTCTQPGELRGIDLPLFEALPRLKRLDIQLAGPSSQKGFKIRRNTPQVRW